MRYEKSETLLRIALDMQGSSTGISLEDIQRNYSDKPISRRTAERLRDTLERLFPQLEQANPGEVPKRWRLVTGTTQGLAAVSAEELADLALAVSMLRRENLQVQAENAELVISKIRALSKKPTINRIDPDLEILTEAEGLAMRPGPKLKINREIIAKLRQAIITRKKVRLNYLYRGSRKKGHEIVHPYGFLYGKRHYLVAWSEKEKARDFRNYALSNIESVDIRNSSFTPLSKFDLTNYAKQSFGVFREKPVDVVWKFSPKAAVDAMEFVFHPDQTFENLKDGSLIVKFRAGGLLEMAWHLITWGKEVEVLAPAELRELLKNLGK